MSTRERDGGIIAIANLSTSSLSSTKRNVPDHVLNFYGIYPRRIYLLKKERSLNQKSTY
jgi:hypothetical protein